MPTDSSSGKLGEKPFRFRGLKNVPCWENLVWDLFGRIALRISRRFVRDDDATFGLSCFDLTEAETKAMVQPHGMTDNFIRKSMTVIAGRWLVHAAQSAKPELN